MLSFFRINDPYRLLGLLILFLVISLPAFLYLPGITWPELESLVIGQKISEGLTPHSELIESTPILSQWMYGVLDFLAGSNFTTRHLFGFIILFFQACYLGVVFINKKAFTENTYLPSVFFCILCTLSFDILSVSGTLLASGFLLLAIHSLLKEIEFREPNDETLLKLGVYLSLASLSVFSYVVFFFGAQLILILFTRTSVRRQLLFLTGFLLPHGLMLVWYFYFDNHVALLDFFYLANVFVSEEQFVSVKTILLLCSVPLFYLFVSIFILNRAVRLTNYQSQLLQTMFLWLLAGVVHLFFTRSFRPQSLLPLFPPISFLFTHFLLAIRRRRIAEFHLWILILGMFITSALVKKESIPGATYKALLVPVEEKKLKSASVLILDEQRAQYLNTPLATGLCEWRLVKTIFEQPVRYSSVVNLHKQLMLGKPELIVDPHGLLTPLSNYLPEFEKAYAKKGNVFYLKKN